MVYSAGTAFLSVVPSFLGIEKAFEREAEKIGKQVDDAISRAVPEGLRDAAKRAKHEGERAGDTYGGAFGRSAGRAVKAALSNLPAINLTANSKPADREIALLRDRLARLGDAKIGVDIDATDLHAEIRSIEQRLREIAREDPRIDIHTNLLATAAELSAVQRMVDDLDRRDVEIDVDTSDGRAGLSRITEAADVSMSRLELLISVGAAIGPAIVPVAAAAAAAISGIGTAAFASVAGIGVLALGLSGIPGAVKALDQFQKDSDKSAQNLSASESRVAGALDQVKGAVAGVRSAERNLTRAQRDATEAIKELVRAREEARRQLEDMALSVKSNALAQRQARLDEAEAKRELDRILANPRATEEEREQARITHEQRLLQIEELGIRQGRLVTDEEAARKKGIEGSDQVVRAQERIADSVDRVVAAQESVAASQRSLAAANRSLRQAYEKTGVAGGDALRNLREEMDALSPAGRRFALFIFGLKDDFEALRGAAERGLLPGLERGIRSLLGFLPQITRFVGNVGEAMGDIFVDFTDGMRDPIWRRFFGYLDQTAVPTLKGMAEFASNVARGIAGVILGLSGFNRPIGRGLLDWAEGFAKWAESLDDNRGWQRFLQYVRINGPKVVELFANIWDLTKKIVIAAAPIGAVLVDVLADLIGWLAGLDTSTWTAIIAAVGALSVALLIQSAVLRGYQTIATLVTNTKLVFGRVQTWLTGVMVQYQLATMGAAGSTAALNTNLAVTAGTATAAGGALRSTAMAGTALNLAIAAIIVGLTYLWMKSEEWENRAKSMVDNLGQLAAEYNKTGTVSKQFVRDLTSLNPEARRQIDMFDRMGVSAESLARAYNGSAADVEAAANAIDRRITELQDEFSQNPFSGDFWDLGANQDREDEIESLAKMQEQLRKNAEEQRKWNAVNTEGVKRFQALVNGVQSVQGALTAANAGARQYEAAIDGIVKVSGDAAHKQSALATVAAKIADSQLDAAEKAGLFEKILDNLGDAADSYGPTFDALAGAFTSIAKSALDARDKSNLLRDALDRMYGAAIAQTEATEDVARTQVELTKRLGDNRAGFDLSAKSARGNTEDVLSNRDALQDALQALRDKYVQDIANGVAEDKARENHQKSTKTLLDQIPVTQRNSQAVKDLVRDYGSIPPVKETDVSTPGLDKAILDLITAHAINSGLSAKPPWTKDRINTEVKILRASIFGGYAGDPRAFKAEGGQIEGWSPHKRADNLPIWATAGEYMHQVDAVDYYGTGVMDAINQRRIPRQMLRGYARGGLIGGGVDKRKWPIDIPHNVVMSPPTIDEWWRKYDAELGAFFSLGGDFGSGPGFSPWPSSPMAQRGDSGVWRTIVALIRSTGPPSGSFGNSYRPGDPLWHGSGRAVDWMGYNQDALATFLAAQRPLELIHRTSKRDYAFTRGHDRGSFNDALMEEHRNHIHIAMDQGGMLPTGLSYIFNGTGHPEPVLTSQQWQSVDALARGTGGGPRTVNNYQFRDTTLDPAKLRAIQDREDALARLDRPR